MDQIMERFRDKGKGKEVEKKRVKEGVGEA
jgi:hypothetical protein